MRARLIVNDCLEAMRGMEENSIDAIVTDPPYGIGFMNSQWDAAVPGEDWARECLRVLKPGGHLIAFAATRTIHRLTVAVEDAGFEIRDQIAHIQFQGFPKSLDCSKSIDRQRYGRDQVLTVTRWIAESRDRAGVTNKQIDEAFGFDGMAGHWTSQQSQPAVPTIEQIPRLLEVLKIEEPPAEIGRLIWDLNGPKGQPGEAWFRREVMGEREKRESWGQAFVGGRDYEQTQISITAPATPDAQRFAGYGTALKPAFEPAVLARKPLSGTVAANCLEWGTGGLNIDGCRYAYGDPAWPGPGDAVTGYPAGPGGNTFTVGGVPDGTRSKPWSAPELGRWPANIYACPKPSRSEREQGCEELPGKRREDVTGRKAGSAGQNHARSGMTRTGDTGNYHPTVKPIQLMRWLVRLVSPPALDGLPPVVLDPFLGSGTTGIAAMAEGVRFIGIERNPEYMDIAQARIVDSVGRMFASQVQRIDRS